jgi:hypothetical protein
MTTIGLLNEIGIVASTFSFLWGIIKLIFTGYGGIWFWFGLLGLIVLLLVQAPVRFIKKKDFKVTSDQTVLITGASTGIGLALAKVFAQHGYNLLLVSRSEDKLREAADKIKKSVPGFNKKVDYIPSDLSDTSSAQKLFDEVTSRGYHIDILVNNAGSGVAKKIAETDQKTQGDMCTLNVTSLTQLTSLFLPAMLEKKSGGILNVGSTAAYFPGTNMASYYATKAYVLSFSEALWQECLGTGIHVSMLAPGPTESEFSRAAGNDKSNLFKYGNVVPAEVVAEMGFNGFIHNIKVVIADHPSNAVSPFLSPILPRFVQAFAAGFMNKITH